MGTGMGMGMGTEVGTEVGTQTGMAIFKTGNVESGNPGIGESGNRGMRFPILKIAYANL